MRKILILIALILSIAACQQRTGKTAVNGNESLQKTGTLWNDSAQRLYFALQHYYENSIKDSFDLCLPAFMEMCREHNDVFHYYVTWSHKIDLLSWEADFQSATQEAKAMFDDATEHKDSFGIANACLSMGHIYFIQDNFQEAIKSFAKAVDYYPDDMNPANLFITYFYYTQSTTLLEDHESTDSLLQRWAKRLYKHPVIPGSEDADVRANWHVQYLYNRFEHLHKTGRIAEAEPLIDSLYYYEELEGNLPLNVGLITSAYVELLMEKKDYANALVQNARYQSLVDELDNAGGKVSAFTYQAQIMKELGRYREAYEALESAKTTNDSLTQADNREELNELNKRFEVNELKMQQERERMQAQQHQLLLMAVIGALILIAIIVVVVMRLRAARRLAAVSAQKERIESELRIARDIQMSMVPHTFPEREGLDMYASMTPAREVGGDLYDYILSGQRLYFCLGDVSGKGVPASLFMAQTLRLFRSMAKQGMLPADICTRMNDELTDGNESAMFVTLFIGLLDLTTGHLDFCNAGHNPPVITMDNGQWTMDNDGAAANCQLSILNSQFLNVLPNAPIGLWPDLQYEGEEIDTIKGRPLFLYTDGLNEAENTDKEQFGDDRLINILRNTHFDSARQVIENLEATVAAHRNGAEPNDDLTMLCLRVR